MERKNVSVRGMNLDIYTSVKNICKNQGTTFKDFTRPIIMGLIDKTDDKYKGVCIQTEKKTIRLSEIISQSQYNQLKNICDNIGVPISSYLKIKIAEELLNYPGYLKDIIE